VRVTRHLRELEETVPGWDREASLSKLERVNREEGWSWDELVPGRAHWWIRREKVRLTSDELAEVRRRLAR